MPGLLMISFSLTAKSSAEKNNSDFIAENCKGSANADSVCEMEEEEDGNWTRPNNSNIEEDPQANCNSAEARTCCADPTTCLGGSALSTYKEVNNMVTLVGPGLATTAQGFGKDMAGMCEALQYMAAGGASVSLAASQTCSGKISTCTSDCDNKIEFACKKYFDKKTHCQSSCHSRPQSNHCVRAKNTFYNKGKQSADNIANWQDTKAECAEQKAKSDTLLNDMSQMANTAINAQMCKLQSRLTSKKENCKSAGGQWKEDGCVYPKEQCLSQGKKWKEGKEGKGGKCYEPTVAGPNPDDRLPPPQNPPLTTGQEKLDLGDNDDDNSPTTSSSTGENTGGGGTTAGGPSPSIDTAGPNNPADSEEEEDEDSTAGGKMVSSGGGGSTKGLSGFAPSRKPARYRKKNNKDDDDKTLSMGGGGFSSYGRGRKSKSDDYADLRLSKEKLKEMEKKKGPKRATGLDGKIGGAHQNIFERISKRFQSLCKNKIDCK